MSSFDSRELTDLLGPETVDVDPGVSWSVEGGRVGCRVSPNDTAGVASVLKLANRHGWTVVVRGSGTKLDWGGPLTRPVDVLLCTDRLTRVRWYTPRDQTISVEAGMTLATLRATLATEGQYLPIHPPWADRATIGGIIATDSSGPNRLALGTVRDYLIGIEYVTPDGTPAKAGGNVVKNVAGYNLMQLHTGAFGQLGVITAVNFKLRPAPRAEALLAVSVAGQPAARVEAVVAALLASEVRPLLLELLDTPTERTLFVGFAEDSAAAVDWQTDQTTRLLRESFGLSAEVLTASVRALRAAALEDNFRREALAKLAVPSSRAAEMVNRALARLAEASPPLRWSLQSSLAIGLIWLVPGNDAGEEMPPIAEVLRVEPVAAALTELRAECQELGGSLVLLSAPPALKRVLSVWGPPRSDWPLMAALKAELDPRGVLNPGRIV